MSLALATIPDDPDQIPTWLEDHFVNGTIGELAAELMATHGKTGTSVEFQSYLPAVYERGLSALPRQLLQILLRHPECLLDIQEKVLINGGEYWERLLPKPEGWARLAAQLPRSERSQKTWYLQPRVLLTTLAASILVTILLIQQSGIRPAPSQANWGWAKSLPQEKDPKRYLNSLADQVDEWFLQQPQDFATMHQRLEEFRAGCRKLVASEHLALTTSQKEWLVAMCEKWSRQIDDHIAALARGETVAVVRGNIDDLVRKASMILREEAAKS